MDAELAVSMLLQAIKTCPICNGTVSLESFGAGTKAYGCDSGCEIAFVDFSHSPCGAEAEAYEFGELFYETDEDILRLAESLREAISRGMSGL